MLRALLLLVVTVAFGGCENEYACTSGGCDGGESSSSDAGPRPAAFEIVVPRMLSETRVSGGLATVRVDVTSPGPEDVPVDLQGPWLPAADADMRVEVRVNTTNALLGGRGEGDFVPYLRLELAITNRDTDEVLRARLVPAVSIGRGLSYARNIALLDELGRSTRGYSVAVTVRRPVFIGESEEDRDSPGIVLDDDLVGSTAGTVFGERPAVVTAEFSLQP